MSIPQIKLQELLDDTLNNFFPLNTNSNSNDNSHLRFPLYDICYSTLFSNITGLTEEFREVEESKEEVRREDEVIDEDYSSLPDLIPLDEEVAPQTTNENIQNANSQQQITMWTNLVEDYNAQINTYQQNIQSILRITENLLPIIQQPFQQPFQQPLQQQQQPPRPTTTTPNNRRRTLASQIRDWFRTNSSDYILEFENITPFVFTNANANANTNANTYPTTQEIQNATELFINDSRNVLAYNTCPISLEEFREGEPLMRIHHCGHIFKAFELQRWFLRHTQCPSCRYDIRTSTSTNNNSS